MKAGISEAISSFWLPSSHFLWILASQLFVTLFSSASPTLWWDTFQTEIIPSWAMRSLASFLKKQKSLALSCKQIPRWKNNHFFVSLSRYSDFLGTFTTWKCTLSLLVECLPEFAGWIKWHFQLERQRGMEWETQSWFFSSATKVFKELATYSSGLGMSQAAVFTFCFGASSHCLNCYRPFRPNLVSESRLI